MLKAVVPSYLRNNFVFSSILKALVDAEDPDVLVLVETKLQDKDVAKVTAKLRNVMSSNVYPTVEFACMTAGDDSNTGKLGTSGVCVITKATRWVYGDEIGPCGFGPTSD